MKRTLFTIMAMISIIISANAQEQNKRLNHLRQQTNGLVSILQLDDKGAAKFTEVYERYKKEMMAVTREGRPERKPQADNQAQKGERKNGQVRKERPQLTDAEIEKRILENFTRSRKILDIRERYYKEFRTFLTPRQIEKMYSMERESMNGLMKNGNRGHNHQPMPGQRPNQHRPMMKK